MNFTPLIRKSAFFAGVLCCGLFVGCVSEKEYRTQSQPAEYNPKAAKDSHAIIEVAPLYTVGFVEFDDQGWIYGSEDKSRQRQIDTVLDRFSAEGETNGLLMVTFVHGWKHNADGNDGNVLMFHHVLKELGLMRLLRSRYSAAACSRALPLRPRRGDPTLVGIGGATESDQPEI